MGKHFEMALVVENMRLNSGENPDNRAQGNCPARYKNHNLKGGTSLRRRETGERKQGSQEMMPTPVLTKIDRTTPHSFHTVTPVQTETMCMEIRLEPELTV